MKDSDDKVTLDDVLSEEFKIDTGAVSPLGQYIINAKNVEGRDRDIALYSSMLLTLIRVELMGGIHDVVDQSLTVKFSDAVRGYRNSTIYR